LALSTGLNLVFLASSRKFLYTIDADFKPITVSTAIDKLAASEQKKLSFSNIAGLLAASGCRSVVVDSSSEEIAQAYPEFLRRGISIVTPNKKAFSSTQELWDELYPTPRPDNYGLIYHEATVCANLPVLTILQDLIITGDKIRRIQGVFSGSLSFLLNSFSNSDPTISKSWSTEVGIAREAGYTEPDPRDDLSGLDVARKLMILARLVGVKVESPTAFPVDSLIPSSLTECSREDFLQRLPEFDDNMAEIRDASKAEGKVLCHVGSIDVNKSQLKVGLERLDKSHPLATLPGSASSVGFYTERYGEVPLVITAVVGGGESTAMAVVADLARVLREIQA
jgi:homoserine dehydrogenase